jgi:hypothetical protein
MPACGRPHTNADYVSTWHCFFFLLSTRLLKTDSMMNGVVKVTKDPKGPTGPNLKYQTSSQHSDNQSNPYDGLTRSHYRDNHGIFNALHKHLHPVLQDCFICSLWSALCTAALQCHYNLWSKNDFEPDIFNVMRHRSPILFCSIANLCYNGRAKC